jgi:hypothetical protein
VFGNDRDALAYASISTASETRQPGRVPSEGGALAANVATADGAAVANQVMTWY